MLEALHCTEASLDHDMGLHNDDPDAPDADLGRGWSDEDGYELVKWMCENDLVPPRVAIHSWNPVGARQMAAALREAGCPAVIVRPWARST